MLGVSLSQQSGQHTLREAVQPWDEVWGVTQGVIWGLWQGNG